MRRILRHLFTLCSALSLLLCVAVCVLWVRSYWLKDTVRLYDRLPGGRRIYTGEHVYSDRGRITLTRFDPVWRTLGGKEGWSVGGFGRYRERPVDYREPIFWHYQVPHWSIALVTAILPAVWLKQDWRAANAARAGTKCCPTCGFDLRAHAAGD